MHINSESVSLIIAFPIVTGEELAHISTKSLGKNITLYDLILMQESVYDCPSTVALSTLWQ